MIGFTLNGKPAQADLHPLTRLLDVLRDHCGDTSVKEGCGEGECGACSVFIDGKIVNACLIPIGRIEGCDVVTMTGLAATKPGEMLVDSFAREGAVQCGFCIPGVVMAADALLRANPNPTESEIRRGLSGNLCRCTGYDLIVRAVHAASTQGRGLW